MSIPVLIGKTFAVGCELLYRGNEADFQYIKGRLEMRKGVTVKKIECGVFHRMHATGTAANPISEAVVRELLDADSQIDLKN